MASLAGIVSQNGKINYNSSEHMGKMLSAMSHRGPDNMIIRSLSNHRGALGANEITLAHDRTRCTSFESTPYILFDGRLFNERENGQKDLEFFSELYKKYGQECFSMLDGSFSCAIVKKDQEVLLVRDHIGASPLFYGYENDVFFFGTEMKALKDHVQFNIEELPPGHIYSSKTGLRRFEAFLPDVPEPSNLKDAAVQLRELLIDAVRRRMDNANAVALSGGLDSSIIAAIAKIFNPDIKLFTGIVQKAPGPDLANAKLMADFLGLEHHIYEITEEDIKNFLPKAVWHLESFDEDCISGIISNYFVSKMVKEYSNTVFVGEGADELFGGYRMVLKNPKIRNNEHRERLAENLLNISYNTSLRRLDRSWMSNAVIYKTPFLDTRVVAFSKKIPMEWKIYGEKQIEKYILREAFRDMLPESIVNREKLRFAMGTGMDDVMDDIISGIVDPKEFKNRSCATYGMPFASFKELYYYDEFLHHFPPSYEQQTVRWDPFK